MRIPTITESTMDNLSETRELQKRTGETWRAKRLQAGLTLAAACSRLGISGAHLLAIERGDETPTSELLMLMHEIYEDDCPPPAWLKGAEDQ